MAIHNFAAVDLGASRGRVILATTSDGKINLEEIHRFADPIIEMQGHFYWDYVKFYIQKAKSVDSKSIVKYK